jgi:hypothetical protein
MEFTAQDLRQKIEQYFDVDLSTKIRDKKHYIPRQFFYYIGVNYIGFKAIHLCEMIGQVHGTESNAISKIEGLIKVGDDSTTLTLNKVLRYIGLYQNIREMQRRYDTLLKKHFKYRNEIRRLKLKIKKLENTESCTI